ncbi:MULTISPECIES: flagellar biosynthetic protein FliO [unclassified Massilia]|uniref:flagellar biosynthetic protein FliO n=1 Tax=unclassified Massilia TaxID=2609279 RepID=UPI001E5A8251|nr:MULTISPECIES: flagellar biosynthetic protein FliO [unclassified Massilia]
MMSTRATACPPATSSAASTRVVRPASWSVRMARGGAGALLASLCLLPLAACAMQPASTGSGTTAAPVAAQPVTPAPAARQQDGASAAAGRQDSGVPAQASIPVAPRNTAPAASPNTPTDTPVAERATTVGEVPTTAGVSDAPAPAVASMPAAPAAIPGTPANPASTVTMPQAAPGPSTGSLLQTIFALVLVLALLAALAWAAKRYGPRVTGSTANLRMVGALNIGGRERIMVVEVGDQWIVVGASPGRVNALATMPKGDAGANTAAGATLAGHTPSASNFSDWLKQTIDKRNAK